MRGSDQSGHLVTFTSFLPPGFCLFFLPAKSLCCFAAELTPGVVLCKEYSRVLRAALLGGGEG